MSIETTVSPPIAGGFPEPRAGGIRSRAWSVWRLTKRQPIGMAGSCVLAAVLLLAILAPTIATHSPTRTSTDILEAPSASHFMGTDWQGRDVFSRIVYGARISTIIGISATGLIVVLGGLVGLVSGYFMGTLDLVIQRILDIIMAFPSLIMALAIVAALGPSGFTVIAAILFAGMPRAARIIRSAVISARTEDYILAARSLGARDTRILFRHLLPNVMAPLLVVFGIYLSLAILIEASLSFLGLGIPPPDPSWGRDLSGEARTYFGIAPWLGIFPGLAITIVVLSANFVADMLRDELDPRLRGA